MARSRFKSGFNRVFQNYLGKWTAMGISIGVVAGLGALAFYYLIEFSTVFILGGITGYYPPGPAAEPGIPMTSSPNFLLIPVSTALGGLLAGLIVYKLAPEAEGHGTDEAIAAIHKKQGKIRRRVPLVKTIASVFTIGSGGSGGREGPTAQIAAGFGSMVADLFRLTTKERRIAVAVGIGAGIGSIFKTPFGSAILSAEILYSGGDLEVEALVPAFIASSVGYVVFASVTGFTPIFGSSIFYEFAEPRNLLIYALLGIACGLLGRFFTTFFYSTKKLFASLAISKYFRPMLGAAMTGLIAVFFPQVMGLGYGYLQELIDGKLELIAPNFISLPLIATLVTLIFLKIVATSLTVSSGGSAGVFAPSLAIGGFTGAAFWVAANSLAPGWIPIPAPLVIVGMMALFAGVGRAPIAVILMVSEMTGTLALMVPAMVSVVLAYYITGSKYTIYRSQVSRRSESPAHVCEYNVPLLKRLFVADAMNINIISLPPGESVQKAYQLMIEKSFRGMPIVESGVLVGIVTISDILRVPRENMGTTTLGSIMTKNMQVAHVDETLLDVLDKMILHGVGRLPVVSRNTKELVGIITRTDVMHSYGMALKLLDAEQQRTPEVKPG
jgi:CIC family chloride channel protein